ncbi:hypothetical protein HY947_01165, partial [Candidatus Gottesmanbacteria bacterium]|nr:hypothetical protein [Candidatus Gottesmanbacteria bacterium]
MSGNRIKIERPIRLAIFISGSGTTMEAIVQASKKDGPLFGKILPVVVISDRVCEGLVKAKKLGVPAVVVTRPISSDGKELFAIFDKFHPDVISQNGWLSKTPLSVIEKFEGRIYNQHPAPLDPENRGSDGMPLHFGGKGIFGKAAHASVLEFQRLLGRIFPSEASIHRVTEQFDEGEVVARRKIEIITGDTAESLARRMLPIEHDLQIEFLKHVYDGKVK